MKGWWARESGDFDWERDGEVGCGEGGADG